MDTARQVIRWSIPGSLLIMSLCGVYTCLRLAIGVDLQASLSPITENVSPAAGIALSVPLGFVCFAAYEWSYRPRRWLGIVSSNRGAVILRFLKEEQRRTIEGAIPGRLLVPWHQVGEPARRTLIRAGHAQLLVDGWASPEVRPNERGRLLRRTHWHELVPDGRHGPRRWSSKELKVAFRDLYAARWDTHYTLVSVLTDVSTLVKDAAAIKAHGRNAADVYHGIGACQRAIIGGTIAGLAAHVFQLATERGPHDTTAVIASAIATAILAAATFLALIVLAHVRGTRFLQSAERIGYGLRVAFARDPELLGNLRDDFVVRRGAGEATRDAALDRADGLGIPAPAIWLRYAMSVGLDPLDSLPGNDDETIERQSEETDAMARTALAKLSDKDFSAAMALSRVEQLL